MTKKEIEKIVDGLIIKFPKQSKLYNQGKTVVGFFIGQVMKNSNGELVDCQELVEEVVIEKLSKVEI